MAWGSHRAGAAWDGIYFGTMCKCSCSPPFGKCDFLRGLAATLHPLTSSVTEAPPFPSAIPMAVPRKGRAPRDRGGKTELSRWRTPAALFAWASGHGSRVVEEGGFACRGEKHPEISRVACRVITPLGAVAFLL
jgi:hypothetical protein